MEIKYMEADLSAVMQFWVKAYELPENTHIHRWEWAWNPTTGRVMFKVFVSDGPDPLA
jgi:hypothetical protein